MLLNNLTNFQYYFVPNQKSNLKVQTTIADANLRYVPILKFSLCLFLFRIERTTQCSFVGKKKICEKNIKYIWYCTPREVFIGTLQGLPILLKIDDTFVVFNCQCNRFLHILKYFQNLANPTMRLCYLFKYLVGLNSAITSLLSNIAFIPTTIGVFRIKKGTIYQYVVCVKVKEGTIFQRTPRY